MIINLHFLFIFFLSFTPIIASPSPPSNFTVYGTADVNRTSITLTQNLHNCTPNAHISNIGRVFYKNPIRFLDSTSNSTLSFSTRFSFTVVPPPPPCLAVAGEGLAFVITSDSNSLPHSVGCIGLPKSLDQFSSDSSFLAVEFDTNFDQNLGDINDNHVGIDVDSIFSVASVDLKSIGIDLKSGKRITSWIEYRNSEKMIQIWVGYTQIKPETPILVAPLDVFKRFNGFMYVGFSGSNGRGFTTYLIDNWRFKTSESVPPNIEVETVESEKCLICFPEDYGKDEEHKKNNHHSDKMVFVLALGLLGLYLILFLLTVYLVFCILMKRRNPSRNPPEEPQISTRFPENRMPKRLKLSEIRSATKGFSRNQIVNENASAIVYKTHLSSFGNVAVKRFKKTASFEPQFVTEFVKTTGSLRHKNLVQLRGWCCEKKELILVYEFIENGSLDKILHHRTPANCYNNSLSFESRAKILLGVSSALVYLHEECEKPIIHRNVKTSNIMLDDDFAPKLGDSGIGELYDRNSRARDGTLQAGAIGYLAPEYVFSGVPSVKTDVYSFGVVVLEVASGRPAVDDGGVVAADWVWDLWEKKRLVDGADPRLMGRFNGKDMEMMLMVGLICVHPNYEMRPIMKEVVQMLEGGLVPNLPAVKPTVMIQSVMVEGSPEEVVGDDGVTSWGTPPSQFSKV